MATWLKDTILPEDSIEKDFSTLYETQLVLATTLVSSHQLSDACELLHAVEKAARVGNDLKTLKAVIVSILTFCITEKAWKILTEQITFLAKRRGQKSAAITVIVQSVQVVLKDIVDEALEMEIIAALRIISDGKIYVEKERAMLTQRLSTIKERQGDISAAAEILQEVHVETYGAMTALEKCEFILEQVRLTLEKKDYIRAFILSKKIQRRLLDDVAFSSCKLKFYKLMMIYHEHENDTVELSCDWKAIFDTPVVQAEDGVWKEALEHAVLFAVLSAHDQRQHDLLCRLALEKSLEKVPSFAALMKLFTTPEVIAYPLGMQDVIQSHPIMKTVDRGEQWMKDLHTRVIEHNIRIVAGYYEKIQVGAFANMLGVSEDETEKHVSHLVSNGTIYARIDRPAGIMTFSEPEACEKQVTNYKENIEEMLGMLETTCHLINKENMTYKIC